MNRIRPRRSRLLTRLDEIRQSSQLRPVKKPIAVTELPDGVV